MKPIKPVVAAIALLVSAPSLIATAGAQAYPLECAQRDVQVVTQMEQYGEAQSVPGDVLYEAFRHERDPRSLRGSRGSRARALRQVSARPPWPARCKRAETRPSRSPGMPSH